MKDVPVTRPCSECGHSRFLLINEVADQYGDPGGRYDPALLAIYWGGVLGPLRASVCEGCGLVRHYTDPAALLVDGEAVIEVDVNGSSPYRDGTPGPTARTSKIRLLSFPKGLAELLTVLSRSLAGVDRARRQEIDRAVMKLPYIFENLPPRALSALYFALRAEGAHIELL